MRTHTERCIFVETKLKIMKKRYFFLGISAILSISGLQAQQQFHDSGIPATSIPNTLPEAYLGACDTLSTSYVSSASADGNMFQITATQDILVEGFSCNISGSGTVKIYFKQGAIVGFEANPAAWTVIDSAFVTSAGNDTATFIPIPVDLEVDSGQTYAFYLTGINDGISFNYVPGSLFGDTAAYNSDLIIREGIGIEYPFSTVFTPRIWNGTVHYCPNINYCDNLTTTFAGGNGQNGAVFEVVALKNTVIKHFDAAFGDTGMVYVYYRQGPYAGTTTNINAWTLVDSALVETAGIGLPTSIPFDINVFMEQGDLVSFIIVGDGITQDMDYTNGTAIGALYTSDNTLQVREGEGFVDFSSGSNGFPRVVNANITYCEAEAGETVLCQDLYTTDTLGNSNNGIMFDIDALSKPVEIESFETYLTDPGTSDVKVFYKMGTCIGFDADTNAWTLLDSANYTTVNANEKITIPVGLEIPINTKMSFFIYTADNFVAYSNGKGVTIPDTIQAQSMYIRVHEGYGKGGYFTSGNNSPRVFNGYVNYCALENFIGVEEPETVLSEMQVWPNPTNGIVHISIADVTENIQRVEIVNLEGKLVYSAAQPASNMLSIDISDQANGLYFIKVSTEKSIYTSKCLLAK